MCDELKANQGAGCGGGARAQGGGTGGGVRRWVAWAAGGRTVSMPQEVVTRWGWGRALPCVLWHGDYETRGG